jgi:DNA/RNA endonuclease G (NUC1)
MAPAADFKDSMDDTFNLCNVSPQVHSMNISIWAKLEHFCRAVAKREKKECDGITYVVTGPLWLPAKQTSEKRFEYNYSAIGRPSSLVHVPTHFFKVVVVVAEDTIRKFACFVVPNTEEDQTKALLEDYVVDFADLETVSGLQFFPSMTAEEGWRERASTITDKVRSNRSKSSFPALTDMTSSKLGWNKSSSSITLKHLCEVG